MLRPKLILLTFVAIAAQIGLSHLWLGWQGDVDPDSSSFSVLAYAPLLALVSVAPSFLLCLYAQRRGFLLGALVGVCSGPVEIVLVALRWGTVPSLSAFAPQLIAAAMGTAITCSVAGAAGQLASQWVRSNYALKPTAGDALGANDPPGPAAA